MLRPSGRAEGSVQGALAAGVDRGVREVPRQLRRGEGAAGGGAARAGAGARGAAQHGDGARQHAARAALQPPHPRQQPHLPGRAADRPGGHPPTLTQNREADTYKLENC